MKTATSQQRKDGHRADGLYLAEQWVSPSISDFRVKQYAVVWVADGKVVRKSIHVTRETHARNIDGMWKLEAKDYPSVLETGLRWADVSRALRKRKAVA